MAALKPKVKLELANKLASLEAARSEFVAARACQRTTELNIAVKYAGFTRTEIDHALRRLSTLAEVTKRTRKAVRRAQSKLRTWSRARGIGERRDVRRGLREADQTVRGSGGAS